MSFQTQMHFVRPEFRGYRLPNQWSGVNVDLSGPTGEMRTITVHNARSLQPAPTLESHGFQLIEAPIDIDLLDTEVVTTEFYDYCRHLIKQVTGCQEVRGGGHEYRNGIAGEQGLFSVKPTPNGSGGAYAGGIHADMCAAIESAFSRIVPDERHFECLNVWKSVKPNELVQLRPLIVCDMQSVDPSDIVFIDGVNTGDIRQYKKVVSQQIIHSPNQRWYYFPDMTYDEVLVFKQYDTREENLNLRTVFHTSAHDPNTSSNAPARYTIEVRMQAIFQKEENKEARLSRFLSEISDRYPDGSKSDWWTGPIENYVPPATEARN